MKKFILFCIIFLMSAVTYSQETSVRVMEIYNGTVGSKLKAVPGSPATKDGGKVYDSVIVVVPYGDCPNFSNSSKDSTGIRYGEHMICVRALNDSLSKNKPDSVYIEISLEFETPDGKYTHGGLVLSKGWVALGASTNAINPADTKYKTYLMCQPYFKASMVVKAYAGYPKTPSKITVWKYYRPKR